MDKVKIKQQQDRLNIRKTVFKIFKYQNPRPEIKIGFTRTSEVIELTYKLLFPPFISFLITYYIFIFIRKKVNFPTGLL